METISEEDEIEGKKCISCYFRGGFRLHVYGGSLWIWIL